MIKKVPLIAVAMTAGLGLGFSPVAQAAPSTVTTRTQARAPATVRTVNDNGVNFRGGPGKDYKVLGTVNKGQNLDYRGQQGNWIMGDLWGGPTGVWIHVAYLNR